MSVSIYARCPRCQRFTMTGEEGSNVGGNIFTRILGLPQEKKVGGNLMVRFYACYMCGYQDNSLYRWHDLSPNDPQYSYKPGTW